MFKLSQVLSAHVHQLVYCILYNNINLHWFRTTPPQMNASLCVAQHTRDVRFAARCKVLTRTVCLVHLMLMRYHEY